MLKSIRELRINISWEIEFEKTPDCWNEIQFFWLTMSNYLLLASPPIWEEITQTIELKITESK